MIRTMVCILMSGFLISSCNRSGNPAFDPNVHNADTSAPIIELIKPAANQQFHNNDSLKIEAKATDDLLHSATVKIINDANGAVLKEQFYDMHGHRTYNLNLAYLITTSISNSYSIRIDTEDHFMNKSSKTVRVAVVP